MRRLLTLALLAATPAAANTPSLPPVSIAQTRLAELADAAGFTGVVYVERPGRAPSGLFTGPIVKQIETGGGDVFRWASVTKQIVAVLVMQEVEKGRVVLDAPASRYLPGVTLAGGDAVTVRRLLDHTSGLANPEDGPKDATGTPLAYLRASPPPAPGLDPQCRRGSDRTPGKDFSYNNCDYVVLGALLEAVTGASFASLVQSRIAAPAGIALRVLKPGDRDDIVGTDGKGGTDAAIDIGRYGTAANLAGAPAALLMFDRALIDGKLLGAAARTEMWRGDPRLGYAALGQWSYTVPLKGCAEPVALVERRGEVGNVQVRNVIAPASGIAVVAFADSTVPDFGEPWQGKGFTYDLLSAVLCEVRP